MCRMLPAAGCLEGALSALAVRHAALCLLRQICRLPVATATLGLAALAAMSCACEDLDDTAGAHLYTRPDSPTPASRLSSPEAVGRPLVSRMIQGII